MANYTIHEQQITNKQSSNEPSHRLRAKTYCWIPAQLEIDILLPANEKEKLCSYGSSTQTTKITSSSSKSAQSAQSSGLRSIGSHHLLWSGNDKQDLSFIDQWLYTSFFFQGAIQGALKGSFEGKVNLHKVRRSYLAKNIPFIPSPEFLNDQQRYVIAGNLYLLDEAYMKYITLSRQSVNAFSDYLEQLGRKVAVGRMKMNLTRFSYDERSQL